MVFIIKNEVTNLPSIGIIKYMPIYIGLFRSFLDILITWVALSKPNNFEANPFHINWTASILLGIFACLLPQLILLRWAFNRHIAYWGSYLLALTMYVPMINNIGHII